jgi:fatty-acyl-CoA synthase
MTTTTVGRVGRVARVGRVGRVGPAPQLVEDPTPPVGSIDAMRGEQTAVRRLMRLPTEAQAFFTIARAGLVSPERPDRLRAMFGAVERYGAGGGVISVAAIRYGQRPGLSDELGVLTFTELDQRSNVLANALRARGVREGTGVGILCRNHRGIFDATFAVLKAGGRALYLNTDFAGPQVKEVCARERIEALIYDEEFAGLVGGADAPKGRYLAWTDDPRSGPGDGPTLESLISGGDPEPPAAPATPGTAIMLTSGTSGSPKGATRGQLRGFTPLAAILSRIPFRTREATFVTSPAYHAWGLGMAGLAVALGSTVVLRRRFDAEETLAGLVAHRCTALSVVPVTLNRLLLLGPDRIAAADLSALRIVVSSGAQLEAALAVRALDVFGDIVYNLYGSTEVAWATIATPEDLRAAPGCAGKPPLGTTVRIYDEAGQRLPASTSGRIFVGSGMEFSGYTGGGTKQMIEGLMATGDIGHFDSHGRLFVDGREDEMIVSGGENVFPREIEELLAAHAAILEAAAIGVPDETFGQRLRVFVVLRPGYSLDADSVRGYVKANLARFKVPRDVEFVDRLPRNPAGKVLKRQLADPGGGSEDNPGAHA